MSLKKFLESFLKANKGTGCSNSQLEGHREISHKFHLMNVFRSCSGQAIIEYFILLVLIAAATIIGSSLFYSRVRTSTANFASNCFDAMGQDSLDLTWESEEPWWESDNGEVYIPDPSIGGPVV